jgi:predicted CoA-binding protein
MGGNVTGMGEERNRPTYRVMVGMSEEGYHSKDRGL